MTRFPLMTTTFPLQDKDGVPMGGNSVVMLTQDGAKQKAARNYIKWITGPEAQNVIAHHRLSAHEHPRPGPGASGAV